MNESLSFPGVGLKLEIQYCPRIDVWGRAVLYGVRTTTMLGFCPVWVDTQYPLLTWGKRWKAVDEDGTWNQNEHYPTLTCTPFLHATVSCHGEQVWIRIWNSSQLSQGPWEFDVCSCEQSVLTTLLMSTIMMMDAKSGKGKAEQNEGGEVGVVAI